MRRGGSELRRAEPSHVSQRAHRGRSASGGSSARGWAFSISAKTSASCSLSQGCSTALVTETTPLARISPVVGRKSVSSLAVPPRSYSCGCNAGWPSGCELRSRLRDGLIGPSFVFIELHDPGRFRLLVGLLDQSFFSVRAKVPTEQQRPSALRGKRARTGACDENESA